MSGGAVPSKKPKTTLPSGMDGGLFFLQCPIRSASVSSANLPSLFQRREMWSGTFGLFIETTTLTSRRKAS